MLEVSGIFSNPYLISVRSPSDSLTLLRDDLGVPGRRGDGDSMERSGRLL